MKDCMIGVGEGRMHESALPPPYLLSSIFGTSKRKTCKSRAHNRFLSPPFALRLNLGLNLPNLASSACPKLKPKSALAPELGFQPP